MSRAFLIGMSPRGSGPPGGRAHRGSRQMSALRDLAGGHFDFLAGILFAVDYSVLRGAIIPRALVLERATFVQRTNSHRFMLRDDIWDAPDVLNVTSELCAVDL